MMGMLIFTLLAALVLHPAQSDSVDGNGAAAAGAAAENENDETNDLENEYIRDAHVGKNDEHVQKLRIIGDNAAGVKVKTSGNEYIHKTFEDADVCVTTLQEECQATGSSKKCRDIYANCKALCIAEGLSFHSQSEACARLEEIISPLY